MTRQRKPSAHSELDQLSQELAAAAMADRESREGLQAAEAEVEATRERIREAHSQGTNTAELGKQLKQAKEAVEQTELAVEGVARRAQRAGNDRAQFLAENGEKLLQELRPACDEVVADLRQHAESLVLAHRRWTDLQNQIGSVLAGMGVQPVANAPASHSLAPAIREVKRALRQDIQSPLPTFERQRAQRSDENRKRKLRQEREVA